MQFPKQFVAGVLIGLLLGFLLFEFVLITVINGILCAK